MRTKRWLPIVLALAFAPPLHAQTAATDAFAKWTTAAAVPLPPCSAQSDSKGLEVFVPIIGEAKVVALGEPVHGTHEPLALRNCLFRYLVEHHGFTAIAIESGLNESRQIQAYAAGGPGDVRQLVHDNLTWGFGRFEENVELIDWMHRYNADPAHLSKIRFYGIDMSGGDYTGEWRHAPLILDASLSYLARVIPEKSRQVRAPLVAVQDRFTLPGYASLSDAAKKQLRSDIRRLIKYYAAERGALVAQSSESEFAWAKRNAVLAQQLEAEFRVSRSADSGDDLRPDDYRADETRDAAMAANVRWAIDREGASGRILLFAHDGHVMNAANRGGIWSVYRKAPRSMGQHLRSDLGEQLRIIATSSAFAGPAKSSLVNSVDTQPATTFDTALARVNVPEYVLDLREARDDTVRQWLSRDQSMRTNFTTESIFVPKVAMDAVVYFDSLSATSNGNR